MGLDYRLPRLESPLFLVKKIACADSGNVVGAGLLRLSLESYLLLDPSATPREKMTAMLELQPSALDEAWRRGFDEVEARIPDAIEDRFRKRLIQLGWQKNRSGWSRWTRTTE